MRDKKQMIDVVNNLIESRHIIFEQIVQVGMSGELSHLSEAFEPGNTYNFKLSHFEDVEDFNV